MRTYSTSEIAKMFGIHPNTVMLYEKWGYISNVERKANGYRVYYEKHLNQIKLIQMALNSELIKSYMKFEIQKIIRSAAQGDFKHAIEISKCYLKQVQVDKNNEFKVLNLIDTVLNSESLENKSISYRRNEVAKLLGLSIDVIVYWERYGLLEIPRDNNGYRAYGEYEIMQLRIIQILRNANYSIQCISKMLSKLALSKENRISGLQAVIKSEDGLLSSLPELEGKIVDLINYMDDLLRKEVQY